MGTEYLFRQNISNKNIQTRNTALNVEKIKYQSLQRNLNIDLCEDVNYSCQIKLSNNRTPKLEDFIIFHSSVEGSLVILLIKL